MREMSQLVFLPDEADVSICDDSINYFVAAAAG